jgi:hyperosmotically inducible protein
MLPYYSVFDNLAYQIQGDTVILRGQVTSPTLKSDAETAVSRIEGVEKVVNEIEVLPPSPTDDRIRRAVYRELFAVDSPLMRYGLGAVPPIHIIVKNGNITLEGVVANESDKTMATTLAKRVTGTFSVTNNLRVE